MPLRSSPRCAAGRPSMEKVKVLTPPPSAYGTCVTMVADCTPGIRPSRCSACSTNARRTESFSYCAPERVRFIASRLFGEKLSSSRPAPTSKTRANEISATTSAPRRRPRARLTVVPRPLSFSDSATLVRDANKEGAIPERVPLITTIASVNKNALESRLMVFQPATNFATSAGICARITWMAHCAKKRPSTALPAESRMLSVSN